ncbi:hypothetical protein [Synechococcus sp. PCC 6312]|uniref:hypothetical protein n=1 Tax=Synechococcus sp. (strain ATCC 27167 / PCC 6312) TaxID=195253 RepID=UPI00029F098E|nr:hypothetical protein [Synechococcus sp. PCC 6312]AFY61076.1 hypothetical protein Syn6312_1938 [Synechococcus sp. PCC 6312]
MNTFKYMMITLLSFGLFPQPSFSNNLLLPSIQEAYANPKNEGVLFSNYYILIDIGHGNIEALSMTIPQGFGVINGISVIDQDGNKVEMSYTIDNHLIRLSFNKLLHKENLKIVFKSVKYSNINTRSWLFHLSARLRGRSDFIPFGTARVNIYS